MYNTNSLSSQKHSNITKNNAGLWAGQGGLLSLRKSLVEKGIRLVQHRILQLPKPIQLRDVTGLQSTLNHNHCVIDDNTGENNCRS
jgi:hypothetical protein